MPWLLAYAHTLQHMGEAADGSMWCPSGMCFTLLMPLTISTMLLVEIGLPRKSITFFIHTFHKGICHVPPASNNVYL